ncbi:uncharacterized protein C20orf96 homolog isoform X2 [Natator depressus]|uniref:uncharacterized protein C20orf96 homolog isoform X2 n=1 Tax=Natator depressus TaxID=27790 RepID=UPI003EB82C05
MLNAPRSDPGRWKLCELCVLKTGCSQKGDFPRVLPGFVGSSSRASPGDSVTAGIPKCPSATHGKCIQFLSCVKTGQYNKCRAFSVLPVLFSPSSSLPSKTAPSLNPRFAQQKTSAKETDLTKSLENIKIIKKLTKSKRKSLHELKHHSATLVETNRRLAQDIQQTDASTAKHARDLLQQYEMFGTVIATLQDSSQNQVGVARAELQETEKMVEKNLKKLKHQVDHMNTNVQMLQEELSVLRTYMDKEYPVKAVQIAFMLRNIRNLKEEQQDEMEDIEDLAKTVMQQLEKKVQDEKEQILQAVAKDKGFLYQEGLKQMAVNNRILRNEVQMQKKMPARYRDCSQHPRRGEVFHLVPEALDLKWKGGWMGQALPTELCHHRTQLGQEQDGELYNKSPPLRGQVLQTLPALRKFCSALLLFCQDKLDPSQNNLQESCHRHARSKLGFFWVKARKLPSC